MSANGDPKNEGDGSADPVEAARAAPPLARWWVARGGVGKIAFYGWAMLVVTLLATMATSPGQSFIVGGTFSESIRGDLGVSLSQFSAAYMVATFCASLPLTLVGRLGDRFGTRAVMGGVASLLGAACLFVGGAAWGVEALSLEGATRTGVALVALTVSFFLLRFLGQGALGLVASHALAMWFERRLGLAEALRHMGMPVAVAVLPAVTLVLIDALGWRFAYAVLGVAVWALVLPAVVLAYVNRPEAIGQHLDGERTEPPTEEERREGSEPDGDAWRDDDADVELDAPAVGDAGDAHQRAAAGTRVSADPAAPGELGGVGRQFTLREALRTQAYWIVTSSMVLSAAVGTAFVFHTQPMLADLGFGKTAAAAAVGTLGLVSLIVTLPFGWLVDRVKPARLLPASTALLGAACGCYALASTAPEGDAFGVPFALLTVHAGFALLGLSQGMLFLLASPIFARYYGRRHHGAIRGSLTTFMVVGTSAGPFVFAVWRDLSGGFEAPYAWTAAATAPLVIWALWLKRPA